MASASQAIVAALCASAFAQGAVEVDPAQDGGDEHCLTSYSTGESKRSGCRMRARSEAGFSAVTPFGRLSFAACEVRYTIHFESAGGVAVDGIRVNGPSPCGDVRPCAERWSAVPRPWTGDVRPNGRDAFVLRLNDACFDTCLGWFEGELRLRLDRVHGSWRVRATRAPVGDSGFELRGDWWLEGRDITFKAF